MQRIANYGSFLQAYALKQLIENLGHNVEFVDYHVETPLVKDNVDNSNKYSRNIRKGIETFRYKAPLSHKVAFIHYKHSFNKRYLPFLGVTDKMNYNPLLDCLVIGSDEVFNCIQKTYMLDILLNYSAKATTPKGLLHMQPLLEIQH